MYYESCCPDFFQFFIKKHHEMIFIFYFYFISEIPVLLTGIIPTAVLS